MFRPTGIRLASITKCPIHTDCRPNLPYLAPPVPYLVSLPSPTPPSEKSRHTSPSSSNFTSTAPPPTTCIKYHPPPGEEDVFVRIRRNGNWPHHPKFGALHTKFPRVRSLITRVVEYNQYDVTKESTDEETGEKIIFTWPAGTLETIYESFVVDQTTYDREARYCHQNDQVLDPRTQILEKIQGVNYTYLSTNEGDFYPNLVEGVKGRVGTYWDHCESFLKTERDYVEAMEEQEREIERRSAQDDDDDDDDDEEDGEEEDEGEEEEDVEVEMEEEEEAEVEEEVNEEVEEGVVVQQPQVQARRGRPWKY
ncbi:BQ2448_2200 [Microbotryum intermedium]|uniref:BQ2448_2200 protein n=1 Tax=Microbotryum intermedium TaxID=269621 RepID=A0A238F5J1_9BASI|nr:BQ2448_2200 [Microbotryum intermedium]